MTNDSDDTKGGFFTKNRNWAERYLPVLFSVVVFILLGMFSLNISNEVNNLTNNLDKFYKHPYKVRNAVSDFNLHTLEVVSLWSGRSINNISSSELELIIKNKFVALDSEYLLIKDKYLGGTEDTKALWKSYDTFKNYINTTDLSIDRIVNATKEKHLRFEWLHKRISGEIISSEVMLTKIEDNDEDYFYVVWRDITSRKEYERQLNENLEEKVILLSEIHHRVKNNLAIISGLLELQIFSSKNSKVIGALGTSVQRIKSIAIIHEQIYKTGDFAAISIDESLRLEIENLLKSYSVSKERDIKVTYDLEVIKISINQAIPFGLLINELASNSLKYAFDGVEHPTLSISLHAKKDVIEFNIQDNGIGFNVDKFNNDEDSLTQNLINVFVSQLSGNLDIQSSSDKGTSVTLTFKPTLKRGSSSNLDV